MIMIDKVLTLLHDKFGWNKTDSLTDQGKKLVKDTLVAKSMVDAEVKAFPLDRKHICFDKGHAFVVVNVRDNGRSVFGYYKCGRCGVEDNWQYDY